MSALLEHDNISKARRALMISSVALVIIKDLGISGEAINIFGVTLEIQKERLVLFAQYAVLYLLYIHLYRGWHGLQELRKAAIDSSTSSVIGNLHNDVSKLEGRLRALLNDIDLYREISKENYSDISKFSKQIGELSVQIEKIFVYSNESYRTMRLNYISLDYAPAILISMGSFIYSLN